jgi:hypothetical protein
VRCFWKPDNLVRKRHQAHTASESHFRFSYFTIQVFLLPNRIVMISSIWSRTYVGAERMRPYLSFDGRIKEALVYNSQV